jgi:hypothetical protein
MNESKPVAIVTGSSRGVSAEFVNGIEADDALWGSRHGNRDPLPFFEADESKGIGAMIAFLNKLTVS